MAEPNSRLRPSPHKPIIPQSAPGLRIARHHDEISAAIAQVVASGRYVLGAECEAFEEEFARFLDAPFVIGVNSGTDALTLALLAVGIERGQEVIVPALTAAATASAVRRMGATVRFIDVDPDTRGISPAALSSAISSRTAAVIVVHLHGIPSLLPEIQRIASVHGLAVVEDCAHAHGATIDGRLVGTLSDAAAFSFYPTKNLGALGDSGAVVVHEREQAERVRRYRNYGQKLDGVCVDDGMNSRLDEIRPPYCACCFAISQPTMRSGGHMRAGMTNRLRTSSSEAASDCRFQIRAPSIINMRSRSLIGIAFVTNCLRAGSKQLSIIHWACSGIRDLMAPLFNPTARSRIDSRIRC